MADGATELDMVINIGQALGGEWDAVKRRHRGRDGGRPRGGAIVKVIFENCYLNDEQKARLCPICGEVRADYVKTSTGYGTGGSTYRRSAPDAEGRRPPHVKLKAAGGVRDLDGADPLSPSSAATGSAQAETAAILDELRSRLGLPPIAFKPRTRSGEISAILTHAPRRTMTKPRLN